MKKRYQKLVAAILSVIMFTNAMLPAVALGTTENTDVERETDTINEKEELDEGVFILEDNSEFRIVYIVFDAGYISCAVVYKDKPTVVYSGYYHFNGAKEFDFENEAIISTGKKAESQVSAVDFLLALKPENEVDFAKRITKSHTDISPSVTTTAEALEYAIWAAGWRTPVNSNLLGHSQAYYPIVVYLYESIKGTAREVSAVEYTVNDNLLSILAVVGALFFSNIEAVISNSVQPAADGTMDYFAQKDGTLYLFLVDNTRTKTARINGVTYYWAGWDMEYYIYSGDKDTASKIKRNYAHPDYSNSLLYFAQKAYESYNIANY